MARDDTRDLDPAPEPAGGATLADEVIDRLYEVAIDPLRFEGLLDRWEALMAPRRRAANAVHAPLPELGRLEGHVERADRVLDRVIADEARGAASLLAPLDRTAAFAVDRSLRVVEANAAAAEALGAARGGRVAALTLGAGEAALLAQAIARLFQAGGTRPTVLRARAAAADRVVVLHLRLVRPGPAGTPEAPFVLAVTSELGWPPGFGKLLRAAFGLTPAEGDVVRALAEGAALSEVADARHRSVETVRAQLKAVMGKTGTRSQAELVRLTLATMEMAHGWGEASQGLPAPPPTSRGTGTLEPRPFWTLVLPDGRRLDYLILGDPGGRPILFFPLDYGLVRWPASAEAEAARRGLKVVVPVRPGFSASTPLPRGVPYWPQVADDLARLLDHLGHGRVPLLTLGSDSLIAVALHAAHPNRVRALVACAGVLPMTRPEQVERMHKWHRFVLAGARHTPHLLPFMVKAGFALARRLGKRGFVHAVYGGSAADVAAFEAPETFEAMVCGSEVALSATHSAHDAFAREVVAHEATDWTGPLAALEAAARAGRVPVHFLNGLQDPQVPPATLDEFRADYPWIDFRVIPDAGQLLFFARWREVLPLIAAYA